MSEQDLLGPDTFQDVANRLHRGETIVEGMMDRGFVLKGQLPQTDYSGNPLRRGVIVGYHADPDYWVVGIMHKKKETIGRNDPKIKTSENKYVKVGMWEIDGLPISGGEPTEIGEYVVENGSLVDTGYINGYRLTRLDKVLDEIFKWHSF